MSVFEVIGLVSIALGALGPAVRLLPWPWAATLGHTLSALGALDVHKLQELHK